MEYTLIDKNNWKRREYFDHYFNENPCTYSLTTKLDISALRKKGARLYPSMLYLLTKTVNRYEEFRTFLRDGEPAVYASMSPCYTVFRKETETFSVLWTEYSEDYGTFLAAYEEDVRRYGKNERFEGKPGMPENCFNVSMLPWTSFDGFNLNLRGHGYLLPIFTIGKYFEENAATLLPLAVQAHHAVCDGFHVCRFINDLQEQLREF